MGFLYAGESWKAKIGKLLVEPFLSRALRKGHVMVQNEADHRRVAHYQHNHSTGTLEKLPAGMGVDLEKFSPGEARFGNSEGTRVRFLLAGRLLRDKGAELYLRAAVQLQDLGCEFLVAGEPDEGNPDSLRREEMEEWSGTNGIEWLGRVEEMVPLLRSVDVLVHPTFYGEGLPQILLEAAGCGLPVITTNIPGCREAVTEGENGWILEERSVGALANLMRAAAMDPGERCRRGRRNRQRAQRDFSVEHTNAHVLNVYGSLLAKRGLCPA
jgi:glycosyltransferase involved in cell wall biosynthesis